MAKGLVFGGLNSGGGSNVKSIQRVSIVPTTTTQNVSINYVDISKSFILVELQMVNTGRVALAYTMARFINSTTIELSKPEFIGLVVNITIIELQKVKSIQQLIISVPAGSADTTLQQTQTINQIDISKTFIIANHKNDALNATMSESHHYYTLTNSTTLSINKGVLGTTTHSIFIIENY